MLHTMLDDNLPTQGSAGQQPACIYQDVEYLFTCTNNNGSHIDTTLCHTLVIMSYKKHDDLSNMWSCRARLASWRPFFSKERVRTRIWQQALTQQPHTTQQHHFRSTPPALTPLPFALPYPRRQKNKALRGDGKNEEIKGETTRRRNNNDAYSSTSTNHSWEM